MLTLYSFFYFFLLFCSFSFFFFFFSSRRRHTRFSRDWSSDVCSSDLRSRLIHSFDFYSNLLGVPAARLARVPVVIASQRDLGNLRPPLQRRLHNVVLGLADRVAVNAEIVAEGAAKTGIVASSRIVVIPNGVDTARFCGAPVETRPPGRVIVGTVAMLRPEKGLMDLVRAAGHVVDHFPEARFLIWGEGPLRLPLDRKSVV